MLSTDLRTLLGPLAGAAASLDVAAYLVGGAVRDALLGRETSDVDAVVSGDPWALGRRLARSLPASLFPVDRKRGILRLVLSRPGDGRTVDLKPMEAGILEDLALRDFACDAMAVPLADAAQGRLHASLIDPHGGLWRTWRRGWSAPSGSRSSPTTRGV